MMVYSDFAIENLKERLLSKSMNDRCPKKYAADLYESYEVIRQLQKQIRELQEKAEESEKKENPLSHVKMIEVVHQIGSYEMDEVALLNWDHVSEDRARYCIESGEYCDDVLVIPKRQYLALFRNEPKEESNHGQS